MATRFRKPKKLYGLPTTAEKSLIPKKQGTYAIVLARTPILCSLEHNNLGKRDSPLTDGTTGSPVNRKKNGG